MSDVMLLGVLRMPMPDNPADMGGLEWAQVKDRMRQAADEIEKERAAVDGHIRLIEVLEDEVARLRAELAAERENFHDGVLCHSAETLKLTAELAAANARAAEGEREFQRYIRELDKRTERAEAAEAREIVLRELMREERVSILVKIADALTTAIRKERWDIVIHVRDAVKETNRV